MGWAETKDEPSRFRSRLKICLRCQKIILRKDDLVEQADGVIHCLACAKYLELVTDAG